MPYNDKDWSNLVWINLNLRFYWLMKQFFLIFCKINRWVCTRPPPPLPPPNRATTRRRRRCIWRHKRWVRSGSTDRRLWRRPRRPFIPITTIIITTTSTHKCSRYADWHICFAIIVNVKVNYCSNSVNQVLTNHCWFFRLSSSRIVSALICHCTTLVGKLKIDSMI